MSTTDGHPPEQGPPDDWTPWRGIVRAALWGSVTTVALSLILSVFAWYAPGVLLAVFLRAFLALGIAWLMFGVVHRASGVTGWPLTGLAIGLSLVVLVSNHVVFAVHGVPTRTGTVIGWEWLTPSVLFAVNVIPLVAIILAAVLCHRGVPKGALLDILMSRHS